ncbi:MAG: S9 family peptidase [Actinomycetota bacterium]
MQLPLTFDALARVRTPAQPRWSPDGRFVVFSLSYTDADADAGGSALWLMPRDGGEPHPLTSGRKSDGVPARDTFPCWSPDGTRIAFLSDRGGAMAVWVIPAFGGEAQQLTGENSGCEPVMADPFFAGLEWSPDGSRLVFAAPEPIAEAEGAGRVVGRDYGETYPYVRSRIQLWTVDANAPGPAGAEGLAARRLTSGEFDHGDPRWSPCGRWIAFASNRSLDEGPVSSSINKNYDLWLISADADGGSPERCLTENPGPDFSPRWSPDGQRLAYLAGLRCGPHRDYYRLRVLTVATGETHDLTGEWDRLPEPLSAQCWSADSRELYLSAWSGTETHLYRAIVEEGRVEQLTAGMHVYGPPSAAPDGLLACVEQNSNFLPELELRPPAPPATPVGAAPPATPVGAAPRQEPSAKTRLNDWIWEHERGAQNYISWPNEGFRIEGMLIQPPGYEEGKTYPLLLFSHGGPHHRVTCALNLEWQALAAQGYLVLAPNFRGSAGYGAEFLDADRGDWGGGDYRDLMSGVDALIQNGVADPQRLGMFGGSYGGYMTCWVVANTDRFIAAVARAPITNLVSYYGTTDLRTLTAWDLDGRPWERRELYVERSPITHVTQAKTPTLLLHGEADRRVPVTQSEEFYAALSDLGVPVSFVRYPDEGHLIARPSHVRDYWQRTLDWFQRYDQADSS